MGLLIITDFVFIIQISFKIILLDYSKLSSQNTISSVSLHGFTLRILLTKCTIEACAHVCVCVYAYSTPNESFCYIDQVYSYKPRLWDIWGTHKFYLVVLLLYTMYFIVIIKLRIVSSPVRHINPCRFCFIIQILFKIILLDYPKDLFSYVYSYNYQNFENIHFHCV